MFTNFNAAEQAVHFPADRRLFLGIKPYVFVVIAALLLASVGVAWLQYLTSGLPADPSASLPPVTDADPKGFPWWLCLSHWVNFFFLIIIIRSGLSILADHPRLYWNNNCTPDSEWIKFTPLKIPDNKIWTAKDEARYLSPVVGLPDSWNVFVHYATLNMPVEPNGFYHYNALQQLSYFGVVFILAPIAMLSGMAMSPAIENRFHWVPKLFGNRQGARSVHFLVMLGYLAFIVIHVSMVVATGLVRNMNHIINGTDNPTDTSGLYIGLGFILFIVSFGFLAHWLSWKRPRLLQKIEAFINGTLWKLSINKFKPHIYYQPKDISPYFWANGKVPESEEWRALASDGFKDYKLKVGGLVDNPVELSITDLISLGKEQNITMHHCIQGWSGIAEWGGVPIKTLVELVKPHANVTTVAFYSFGEGLFGGTYYDTHTLDNCMKPASILAWEMNYEPLTPAYGAPLRLRVENQLGYKMVKWIARVDFVESHETIGKGFGGKNEDDEYFDLIANT